MQAGFISEIAHEVIADRQRDAARERRAARELARQANGSHRHSAGQWLSRVAGPFHRSNVIGCQA